MAKLTKQNARNPIIENGRVFPGFGCDHATGALTFKVEINAPDDGAHDYCLELTASEMLFIVSECLKRASTGMVLAPKPRGRAMTLDRPSYTNAITKLRSLSSEIDQLPLSEMLAFALAEQRSRPNANPIDADIEALRVAPLLPSAIKRGEIRNAVLKPPVDQQVVQIRRSK